MDEPFTESHSSVPEFRYSIVYICRLLLQLFNNVCTYILRHHSLCKSAFNENIHGLSSILLGFCCDANVQIP